MGDAALCPQQKGPKRACLASDVKLTGPSESGVSSPESALHTCVPRSLRFLRVYGRYLKPGVREKEAQLGHVLPPSHAHTRSGIRVTPGLILTLPHTWS